MSTRAREGEAPRTPEQELSEFLERLQPGPRGALLTVRAVALSLGPDVKEKVVSGEVLYLRRDRMFLRARPSRSTLLLVFPESLAVEDPMGRLLRRGSERHAPLDSPEALDGHVQEFVRQAYAAAR